MDDYVIIINMIFIITIIITIIFFSTTPQLFARYSEASIGKTSPWYICTEWALHALCKYPWGNRTIVSNRLVFSTRTIKYDRQVKTKHEVKTDQDLGRGRGVVRISESLKTVKNSDSIFRKLEIWCVYF